MSLLPQYKIGNCNCGCGGINVPGRKVGKIFTCMASYTREKQRQQVQKATERNNVRKLNQFPSNKTKISSSIMQEDISLKDWFKSIRPLMKGVCSNCGGKSCKDDDTKFHYSIAHILPKAYFPSVATNEYNWVELCFWNNSCHSQMDNKMLDLIDMNCFDEIIKKFALIYLSIAKEERRRIPEILLQYLETEI